MMGGFFSHNYINVLATVECNKGRLRGVGLTSSVEPLQQTRLFLSSQIQGMRGIPQEKDSALLALKVEGAMRAEIQAASRAEWTPN